MKEHKKKLVKEHELEEADLKSLDEGGYSQHELYRIYANNLEFRNISFKQAIIRECYLRNCTFNNCDFTGSSISKTNLQGSAFSGCTFNYTTFEGTYIGISPIASNLPGWENVKMNLAKNLRMNYASLGDYDGVNFAIKVELDATREHLSKAAFSKESYYRGKPEYSGWGRFQHVMKYAWFRALDTLWGNGERPGRMAFSIPATLLASSLLFCATRDIKFGIAAEETFSTFIFGGRSLDLGSWASAFINLLRIVTIGMFVSSIIRRLSRR